MELDSVEVPCTTESGECNEILWCSSGNHMMAVSA